MIQPLQDNEMRIFQMVGAKINEVITVLNSLTDPQEVNTEAQAEQEND